MPKTPNKMHMYDMVKIDTLVCEIVGRTFNLIRSGGGDFKSPLPPIFCTHAFIFGATIQNCALGTFPKKFLTQWGEKFF